MIDLFLTIVVFLTSFSPVLTISLMILGIYAIKRVLHVLINT